MVSGRKGTKTSHRIQFDFPRLWTPIGQDVQVMDASSGALAYLVAAPLPVPDAPASPDEPAAAPPTLTSLNKKWFGEAIFDTKGWVIKDKGSVIDSWRVATSVPLVREPPPSSGAVVDLSIVDDKTPFIPNDPKPYRQLDLRYTAISPTNQRTIDRRGLVTAVEVGGLVYMFVVSTSAVKWEDEKTQLEDLAASFYLT